MTLLVLVDTVIAALLILVVSAASQVHLAREQLLAIADDAALDASDSLDESSYYASGATPDSGVPLTDSSVRTSVDDYLALVGAATRFGDFEVAPGTGSPDGQTAQVTLAARVRPPLLPAVVAGGWAAGVPIEVTSRARAGLVAP